MFPLLTKYGDSKLLTHLGGIVKACQNATVRKTCDVELAVQFGDRVLHRCWPIPIARTTLA